MHDRAHGLMPHEIVQVNSNVVEAFLGRIADPEGYTDAEDPDLKIFNDPAFRIILVSRTTDRRLLKHQLGLQKADRLIALYHEIMRKQLAAHEGREVELKGEGFIASFVSVTQAVDCAVAIQEDLHVAGELIELRLGLNAGMPVSKSPELFGDTVKMAINLCGIATEQQIGMASIVREIYKDDGRKGRNNGELFYGIEPVDENFLQLLMDTLDQQWKNPQFGVVDFCEKMSMSKSKLYRKVQNLQACLLTNYYAIIV